MHRHCQLPGAGTALVWLKVESLLTSHPQFRQNLRERQSHSRHNSMVHSRQASKADGSGILSGEVKCWPLAELQDPVKAMNCNVCQCMFNIRRRKYHCRKWCVCSHPRRRCCSLLVAATLRSAPGTACPQ